ncbi:WD40 repeat domain-containing protein [Streptomyces sp. CA-142005]|uniref:WD40 repeat domain-containing protein n=1 Tax=Streptomyces sp. CA-142005 TaxID=3240052 RepID=UPI003D9354EB
MSASAESPYAAQVFDRLLHCVPHTDGRRLWQVADPYLLRHAAQHAVQAHRSDELLLDADFLAEAEPDAVLTMLPTASTREARIAAAVYRASYSAHRRLSPHERRQILALDAARFGIAGPLRHHLAHGTGWQYPWATGQQASTALTATLEDHTQAVTDVVVTVLDGLPVAVTAGSRGRVRVWDLATGLTTHTLEGHTGPVTGLAVTELGGLPVVVTVSWDSTLRVWDLAEGHAMGVADARPGASAPLTALAVLQVGGRCMAVTTATGGMAWVWELTIGADRRVRCTRRILSARAEPMISVAAAVLDGWPVAVTTRYDGSATVWDLGENVPAGGMVLEGHQGWVLGAALTVVDGRPTAVTAGRDRTARVWDLVSGRNTAVLRGHTDWVTGVAAARLEGLPVVVTSSRDGTARVWDLSTFRITATTTRARPAEWLTAVAVGDPAGWPMAVTAGQAGNVHVWDLSARSTATSLEGHTNEVTRVRAACVDGRMVAFTAGRDGTARVWDVFAGQTLVVLEDHTGPVNDLAVTVAPGEQPVVLTGSDDGTAHVWQVGSGRRPVVLDGHSDGVRKVGLVVGGGVTFAVTAGADGRVRVWDTARRLRVDTFDCMVRAMDVAVIDGRLAAVFAQEAELHWVWDLDWRRSRVPLAYDGPSPVTAVAASRLGGRPVAFAGADDGSIRILAADGGERLAVLDGHDAAVTDLAVLHQQGANRLVSTAQDLTVRVWDPLGGRLLARLSLPDVPHSAALGPDGTVVVGMGHEVLALQATAIRQEMS